MVNDCMNWVFVGYLEAGSRVYINTDWDTGENIAIERDQMHLVDPTQDERAEIRKMMHVRALKKASTERCSVDSEEAGFGCIPYVPSGKDLRVIRKRL